MGDLTPDEDHERVAPDLLHMAAIKGNTQAQLALAHRYHRGHGVDEDCEAAAFYFGIVAEKALNEHQSEERSKYMIISGFHGKLKITLIKVRWVKKMSALNTKE